MAVETDWAQVQTQCPAGHELKDRSAHYDACRCENMRDGRGHFFVWCDRCRQFYNPPGCPKTHGGT